MRSEEDLKTIVELIVQNVSWNPHALFFVYVDYYVDGVDDYFNKILKAFFKVFAINVTVMGQDRKLRDSVL